MFGENGAQLSDESFSLESAHQSVFILNNNESRWGCPGSPAVKHTYPCNHNVPGLSLAKDLLHALAPPFFPVMVKLSSKGRKK